MNTTAGMAKTSTRKRSPKAPKSTATPAADPKAEPIGVTTFRVPPEVLHALDVRVETLNARKDLPGKATRTGVLVQILRGHAEPLTKELGAIESAAEQETPS